MEHLYAKQVGCGNADTTKWEFMTNIHRDSLASHVGHASRLQLFASIENVSCARKRIEFLEKIVQPCGPPPKQEEEEEEQQIIEK
jgi:splicing factor 3B subunit 5